MRIRIVKQHRSAYERQVHESVVIQKNRGHHLLNSKAEFNRCALPRLALRMGEREFSERYMEKKRREEKLTVTEKIKNLKQNYRVFF